MKIRTLICKYCGKEFQTTSRQRTCCSSECSHKYGAKITKERNRQFKRLYNLNDNFLDELNPIQCWFLGLMASDGYVNSINNTIGIAQSGEEGLKLISYLKNMLNFNGKIYSSKTKSKNSYKIQFTSEKLLKKMEEYNIVPNKTKTYTIPEEILNDLNKLKYFLRGYIDGDGSVGIYKNMLTINFVCNHNMFNQLKDLNIFKNAFLSKRDNVCEFRFNGINAVKFGDIVYDENIDIYKHYKIEKFLDYKKNMFDISPKMKYNFLREKIFSELDMNPNMKCMDYAKENNLNFKYVYSVRSQWQKLKEE